MRILGLDEAGRGSVLGPLVVGAFLVEGDRAAALTAAGADDSKALTPRRRDAARAALRALGQEAFVVIPATAIDEGNVNALEEDAFCRLVAELAPDRVVLDAPVHPGGIPRLRARLQARTGVEDWVVECKADARYPVVGAASIVAKTERDAAIVALGPVGSGYPSDPVTRRVVAELVARDGPLPPWVRARWGTVRELRQRPLFG